MLSLIRSTPLNRCLHGLFYQQFAHTLLSLFRIVGFKFIMYVTVQTYLLFFLKLYKKRLLTIHQQKNMRLPGGSCENSVVPISAYAAALT